MHVVHAQSHNAGFKVFNVQINRQSSIVCVCSLSVSPLKQTKTTFANQKYFDKPPTGWVPR